MGSAAVLAVWAGVTLGSPWIAGPVGESLTRIELWVLAGGLPWTR